MSNISKENSTGGKSINKKKLAQVKTKHFAERVKSLFRLLNSYERPMENLPFQNFLKWPEMTWICELNAFEIFRKCFNHHANAIPANIYLFKINDRNIRKRWGICSKLTIKPLERHHWRRFGVFLVNFKQISQLFLVFASLTEVSPWQNATWKNL